MRHTSKGKVTTNLQGSKYCSDIYACSSTTKTMYNLACKNDGDCGEATLGGTLRTQGCFEGVCRGKSFVLNDFICLEKVIKISYINICGIFI